MDQTRINEITKTIKNTELLLKDFCNEKTGGLEYMKQKIRTLNYSIIINVIRRIVSDNIKEEINSIKRVCLLNNLGHLLERSDRLEKGIQAMLEFYIDLKEKCDELNNNPIDLIEICCEEVFDEINSKYTVSTVVKQKAKSELIHNVSIGLFNVSKISPSEILSRMDYDFTTVKSSIKQELNILLDKYQVKYESGELN